MRKKRNTKPQQRKKAFSPGGTTASEIHPLPVLAAMLALVFYAGCFYLTPLSSAPSGQEMLRGDFLSFLLLPDHVVSSWWCEDQPIGIGDRIPILLTATGILLAASSLGAIVLRMLNLHMLTRLEWMTFALATGLSLVSLYALLLGLLGQLQNRWVFLVPGVLVIGVGAKWLFFFRADRNDAAEGVGVPSLMGKTTNKQDARENGFELPWQWLWLLVPLVLIYLLGGLLPPVDFDVREYHLQVPKQWYQQGYISFLPYNVYGNMPMGAEVLSLPAMAILDDWWRGALVGKLLISCGALWSAAGLLAAGTRFFSRSAGIVATLAYLSTPWVLVVSVGGLVEVYWGGFLFLTLFAFALWRKYQQLSCIVLMGIMAAGAIACKYPAMLFVVVPSVALIVATSGRDWLKPMTLFLISMIVVGGAWYGKNALFAGNPTYPLLYNVFGGKTRDSELDAKWTKAHRPPGRNPLDLPKKLGHVAFFSDWQSPVLIPLMLLAGFTPFWRKKKRFLAGYLCFAFLAWWVFTHQLDRFLVPIIPVVALLAGVGAYWTRSPAWGLFVRLTLCWIVLHGTLFAACGVFLDSRFLMSLQALRDDPRRVKAAHLELNQIVPQGKAVLLVGDAEPFDLEMHVFYSTVFDRCLFEQWLKGCSPSQQLELLHDKNVSHVYVDWAEIARYRSKGNYGFTSYVTRKLLSRMVQEGVLLPPRTETQVRDEEIYPVSKGLRGSHRIVHPSGKMDSD